MEQKYAEYAVQKAAELLAIDSPTGFTDQAAAWVLDAFGALGSHILNLHRTEQQCLRKADRAADGRRVRQIGHNDLHVRVVQAQRDAGGKVARAANQNEHMISPFCNEAVITGQFSSLISCFAASMPPGASA